MDSYSNASGNRRDSMVLSQLGNVITAEPKAVQYALEEAGVKVAKNPTRRDLVRAIVANKKNKKMVQNLSALITASTQSTYSNFGEDDELLPLNKPTSITNPNAQTELAKGKSSDWLKKIGSFFQQGKTNRQSGANTKKSTTSEESGFKRFADWFTKNKDTINDVGQTLYNSLGKGNQIPTGDGGGGDYNTGKQPMPNKTKVFIAVGLVAVLGLAYYFLAGKGKGKGKGK